LKYDVAARLSPNEVAKRLECVRIPPLSVVLIVGVRKKAAESRALQTLRAKETPAIFHARKPSKSHQV